jgi:hypothetical protein
MTATEYIHLVTTVKYNENSPCNRHENVDKNRRDAIWIIHPRRYYRTSYNSLALSKQLFPKVDGDIASASSFLSFSHSFG